MKTIQSVNSRGVKCVSPMHPVAAREACLHNWANPLMIGPPILEPGSIRVGHRPTQTDSFIFFDLLTLFYVSFYIY